MTHDQKRLFRDEALASVRSSALGPIVLVAPLSFTVLTIIAVLLSAAMIALLIFGNYTQRSTVEGQLVSDAGLARIYTPQSGIVTEQHVIEGQKVKTGTVLFVVSSERYNELQSSTQAAVSESVRHRAGSLRTEIANTGVLQEQQRHDVRSKIEGELTEITKIDAQLRGQQQRVQIAEDSAARYKKLSERDMVAIDQMQQKSAEVLDQRARLQDLERDHIYHERELVAARAELKDLTLQQQNQMSQLERDVAVTSQEYAESEAKRRLAITAPEDGIATAVAAHVGQSVDSSKALVSILRDDALLQAELYVPSRSIGFIRPGDRVLVRYQAFPYQKFGHQAGVVQSVSRTALPAEELSSANAVGIATNSEPSYLVIVRLASQSVLAYGQPQALQPGMLLEADILRERRHLYEWALEPLFSLSGRL